MRPHLVLLTVLGSNPDGLLSGSFASLLLPAPISELRDHFQSCLAHDAAARNGRPRISSYVIAVGSARRPTRRNLEQFAKLVADGRLQAWDDFSIEAPADLAPFIGRVDRLSRDLHYGNQASQSEPPPTAEIIPLRRF